MAEVFRFPVDPTKMDNLPTHQDENPYLQMTRRGLQPQPPPVALIPFTHAIFHRVVIPLTNLLANLNEDQANLVKENPSDFIAIVPFEAGDKYYKENPNCNTEILKFIRSLGYPDNEHVDIAKPVPRNKAGKKQFDPPWAMIMSGASSALSNFLLWHQTFAVRPDLAFNALPFDPDLQSWVIMNMSGNAVRKEEPQADQVQAETDPQTEDAPVRREATAKEKALGAIKYKLWHNHEFRAHVTRVLKASGATTDSVAELAYLATTSFDLHYVETKDGETEEDRAPVYQLTGKPLSSKKEDMNEYYRIVRFPGKHYFVGLHKLEVDKRFVNCRWCKSDSHPAHKCPFLQTPDWLGPTQPKKEPTDLKRGEGTSRRGEGTSRRGGAGGSTRGSPRGRGGWNEVSYRRRK
ncbi:hypothetical protein BDZ97DRAFT_84951 [Flammula alnicola]|nr:hypothetical protein BDZ97DRAFT_84951 [Flammula alnicola]